MARAASEHGRWKWNSYLSSWSGYTLWHVVLYKVTEIWNVKILISCLHTNVSNRMLADQLQAFFGELVTTTMCMLSLVWSWKVSFSERHFTDFKPFVIKLRNSRLERKISFREAKTRHLFDFNTRLIHGTRLIWQQNGNFSWLRLTQIKQLAWPMAERQIGHRKSSLVLSTRFPVVEWRSRSVAKSTYCSYWWRF